ncbi:MAG: FAD-dependent oxidoreductase, partial [Opitutales bacterium]
MIVGQGLAGCLLARKLSLGGASCALVGKSMPMAATPVAAGIMNPVTGRRLAKSWRAETYLPQAKDFYLELGREWELPLLHEGRILRFPRDEGEITLFRRRKTDPQYEPFLGEEYPPRHWAERGWADEFGSYEILGVSWVDLEKIASAIRGEFREKDALREERLEHRDLELVDDGITWLDLQAKRVVFCEGAKVLENPWFQYLPFAPSRGETLDLRGKERSTNQILQSRFWLLPGEEGFLRAGSTYDHEDLGSGATEAGREEILDGLAGFLDEDFSVTNQRCGIRPSTRDRLPVMGRHPDHPQ